MITYKTPTTLQKSTGVLLTVMRDGKVVGWIEKLGLCCMYNEKGVLEHNDTFETVEECKEDLEHRYG